MVATARALPAIIDRMPLWKEFHRGQHTTVTLTPAGAIKMMERFKSFSKVTGVTQQSIEAAYKAAAEAARQQRDRRQKPFLVSAAANGGPVFSRNGLTVRTVPLGYYKHIETEAVSAACDSAKSDGGLDRAVLSATTKGYPALGAGAVRGGCGLGSGAVCGMASATCGRFKSDGGVGQGCAAGFSACVAVDAWPDSLLLTELSSHARLGPATTAAPACCPSPAAEGCLYLVILLT